MYYDCTKGSQVNIASKAIGSDVEIVDHENTNMSIHPLRNPGNVWIPLSIMATTNGDAAAPVEALLANARFLESYGTSMPTLSVLIFALVKIGMD
jgi:hypothetical protein